MGAANALMNSIVSKLDETSFGSATSLVQIVPDQRKLQLSDPAIVIAMQGKDVVDLARGSEHVQYKVGVALYYPVASIADHASGLDMAEDIQDWLSQADNRTLTSAYGNFCLVPPFEMDGIFDPTAVREGGVMIFITNFKYRFFKNRN